MFENIAVSLFLFVAVGMLVLCVYRMGQYSTAVANDKAAAHREGYNQAVREVYWKSVEGFHVGSMGSSKDEYCTIGYYADAPVAD